MERRQIGGVFAAGAFTTGGAALWQSLNPALDAATAVNLRLGATFGMVTGVAILGVLFFTARSAKAEELKRSARRQQIGKYLGESRALLGRAREAGDDPAFSNEVQAWANDVAAYLTKEFGESYVETLQHGRRGWRYAGGKQESPVAPFLEKANANLGIMLDRLS